MNSKYFYNSVNQASRGKKIFKFDKLYHGQKYILVDNDVILCGPLIKKDLSDFVDRTNYYGIYFRIGLAKYDGITIKDQIYEYHIQSHCDIIDIQLKIYECYLFQDLQQQIKNQWYYKKTIMNLCKELKICEDIEYYILKFL